jgi:hypothetical protein
MVAPDVEVFCPMPQVQPVASQVAVRAQIERASARTGVNFDYLLGQASIESSLDPSARASTSSASGLFQFISSTWLNTVQKHGSKHGLDWAASQIEQTPKGPVVRDPAARQQILSMRFDPQVASLMAGEFASDNRETLHAALGRAPTDTDLYLAHFLGPAGASSFLRSAGQNPGMAAASLFPKAAAANRTIFYDGSGGQRSLAEVYGLFQNKLDRAIDRTGGTPSSFGGNLGGAGLGMPSFMGAEFMNFAIPTIDDGVMPQGYQSFSNPTAPRPTQIASSQGTPPRASMADTLRANFDLAGGGSDPGTANVRKAYATLKALNL